MVEIKQNLVPQSKYNIKCPYSMNPIGITVHNTANDASANNEINYMISNNNYNSFHFAVDDKKIVQGLPLDRNGFHASDGATGTGNRKTIGIEICYSKSGGDRFIKAEQNAVDLIVYLMKKYNWDISKVKRHYDYAPDKKYCPHRTMDMGWDRFLKMITDKLDNKQTSQTNSFSNIKVGSKVRIDTMPKYKYWIPDEIKVLNGIYQIRENVNAGGEHCFDWIDNGIPESCVDICDKNGKKTADSDKRHIKMGDKFVFAKTFTVIKIAKDGQTYYQLDYDGNLNHRFWVIGDYLKEV
jgi:N-acetylmuramoyl-L-alanine amidase CwlA